MSKRKDKQAKTEKKEAVVPTCSALAVLPPEPDDKFQYAWTKVSNIWLNKPKLTFKFVGSWPKETAKGMVKDCMKAWTGTGTKDDPVLGMQFVECPDASDEDVDIRIANGAPYWRSIVGADAKNAPDKTAPTVELGVVCEANEHLILHELGHALGLEHEHQAKGAPAFDEQAVIKYFGSMCKWSEKLTRAQILTPWTSDQTNATKYDNESIMHYFFPSELFVDKTIKLQENKELSTLDKALVSLLYPVELGKKQKENIRKLYEEKNKISPTTDPRSLFAPTLGEALAFEKAKADPESKISVRNSGSGQAAGVNSGTMNQNSHNTTTKTTKKSKNKVSNRGSGQAVGGDNKGNMTTHNGHVINAAHAGRVTTIDAEIIDTINMGDINMGDSRKKKKKQKKTKPKSSSDEDSSDPSDPSDPSE